MDGFITPRSAPPFPPALCQEETMTVYGIPLDTLDLSPEALSDPTIGWLIQNADPELWAPRHYLIVDEKCRGDHHMIATWFAIYRLLIFYKPIGKRAFGQREIAAVGHVGRGHLSGKNGTIRKLAALELIIIDGYEGGEEDEGTPIFRIDTARLEAESILLTRKRLAAGQLVQRRKPATHGQLDMFRVLGLTPDEELLTLARQERQAGDEYLKVPDVAPIGAGVYSQQGRVAPMGASQVILADNRHQSAPALAPIGATLEALGTRRSQMRHPLVPHLRQEAPVGARHGTHWCRLCGREASIRARCGTDGCRGASSEATRHPLEPPLSHASTTWPLSVPHDGPTAAPAESTVAAPVGASGWMDHENERRREEPRLARGHTHTGSLALIVQQAMTQQLPSLVAAALHQIGVNVSHMAASGLNCASATTLTDAIPHVPGGRARARRGLLSTWQIVSRQDAIPDRDLAQLEVLVSRYDGPTGGHASYWLCRVMWEADRSRDGNEPIRLRVVGGYMRRMEQVGQFSTVVLENKKYDAEKEVGAHERQSGPSGQRDTSPAPRPSAAPQPAAALRSAAASSNSLPPEVADHWVITTWRGYAGTDAVILVERAQHLIATVTRRDVWEAVLANWRSKYKSKANWTNFDGLVDWYSREAAKPVAVTADEFDPDGPPASASVIDNHPGLDSTERADYYRRFHAAGDNKAAKQAVIKRLLAERPIEPAN
jgi:hypothetical protein